MDAVRRCTVDFSGCKTIRALHEVIREGLAPPDFYGCNLDALWDSLTGIIHIPAFISIKGIAALPDDLRADQIVSIFVKAQEEYGQIKAQITGPQ